MQPLQPFLGSQEPKNATPTAFWGPWGSKMQPLQRFGVPGASKSNPYSVLGPLRLKSATPTAFWAHWCSKVQPLQRFEPPGKQNSNPYSVLEPLGSKNATPTTIWGPWEAKMQPLQRFVVPGSKIPETNFLYNRLFTFNYESWVFLQILINPFL